MSVPYVGGNASLPENANVTNAAIRQINAMETVQVFKDDTGTRRVILDKDGLRTSPEGVDVYTASASQYTFNSNNNVFKIVSSGTTTMTPTTNGSGNFTTTIAHGLSFTPIPLVFINYLGSIYKPLPTWTGRSYSGGQVVFNTWVDCETDATNLYIQFFGAPSTTYASFPIKYYLTQETAN